MANIIEFTSLDSMKNAVEEYEISNDVQFNTTNGKQTTYFGKNYIPENCLNKRIWFSGRNDLTRQIEKGIPFLDIGSSVRYCIHGKNQRKTVPTQEMIPEHPASEHAYSKYKRKLSQPSKKLGCGAKIQIKEVLTFPDLQAETEASHRKISKLIKDEINKGNFPKCSRKFFIKFPSNQEHCNHVMGKPSGVNKNVSRGVKDKVFELVASGMTSIDDIQTQLQKHNAEVHKSNPPSRINRQFYPTRKDLYNITQSALSTLRYSSEEQENIAHYIEEVKKSNKDGNLYFNPHREDDGEKMLIVLQTKHQTELLQKFGEVFLIDGTFGTSKYNLPLYQIVVNTNVGYSPVGVIICEDETSESLLGGLKLIKEWTKDWHPTGIFTDYSDSQIKAAKSVFPDLRVYLCKFHVEQAWDRWLSKVDNNLASEKDNILHMLRNIRNADIKDHTKHMDILKNSRVWRENEHLQNYITNYWLSIKERWSISFRDLKENAIISTTNGVEVHHRILKDILAKHSDRTVQKLLEVLVEKYFVQCERSFIEKNVWASSKSKAYSSAIPKFLHDRPKRLIDHCLGRISDASVMVSTRIKGSDSTYKVQGDGYPSEVSLKKPSCSCDDFRKHYMPCKHLLSVVLTFNNWDELPSVYRNSIYYTINSSDHPTDRHLATSFPEPNESIENCASERREPNSTMDLLLVESDACPKNLIQQGNIALNKLKNWMNNSTRGHITATRLLEEVHQHLICRFGTATPQYVCRRRGNVKLGVPGTWIKKRKRLKALKKTFYNHRKGKGAKKPKVNKNQEAVLNAECQTNAVDTDFFVENVSFNDDLPTPTEKSENEVTVIDDEFCGNDSPIFKISATGSSFIDSFNYSSPNKENVDYTEIESDEEIEETRPTMNRKEERELKGDLDDIQLSYRPTGRTKKEKVKVTDSDKFHNKRKSNIDLDECKTAKGERTYHKSKVVTKGHADDSFEEINDSLREPIIPDLDDIWKHYSDSTCLMCRIGHLKLLGNSFGMLRPSEDVPDEIINAYLTILKRNNENTEIIECCEMGRVINFPTKAKGLLLKESLDTFDLVLCPYNSGGHWEILVALPKHRQVIYIDSLGEKDFKISKVEKSWKSFVNKRFMNGREKWGPSSWKVITIPHSLQKDGVNCGIYVMKFAEMLIQNYKKGSVKSKLYIDARQLNSMRRDIGAVLLANSDKVDEFCRNCTRRYTPEDGWVRCNSCFWWCHYGCSGINISIEKVKRRSFVFLCQVCNQDRDEQQVTHPRENQTKDAKLAKSTKTEPFILAQLTNRIKVCQGCRNKFRKPIVIPHDIVLRRKEMGEFFNIHTHSVQQNFGNKYYHVNAHCIAAKHENVTKDDICIPPDINVSKEHLDYFRSRGVNIEDSMKKKIF